MEQLPGYSVSFQTLLSEFYQVFGLKRYYISTYPGVFRSENVVTTVSGT